MIRPSILVFLAVVCLGGAPIPSAAVQRSAAVPKVALEVTVQQREQGKVSPAYHVFRLVCASGHCDLIMLTLNRCMPGGSGKPVFYPNLEHLSTSQGTLSASNLGSVLEARATIFDIGGRSEMVLRFGYAAPATTGAPEVDPVVKTVFSVESVNV